MAVLEEATLAVCPGTCVVPQAGCDGRTLLSCQISLVERFHLGSRVDEEATSPELLVVHSYFNENAKSVVQVCFLGAQRVSRIRSRATTNFLWSVDDGKCRWIMAVLTFTLLAGPACTCMILFDGRL
jgi:hypothetical protein